MEGEGQVIICVQEEDGGHDPGLTGGSRSTVEAHSNAGRDFPKALIRKRTSDRVLKNEQDLQGWESLPQQRRSGASALRSDMQEVRRRGGTSLAYITGLSEPQRKAGNRGKKCEVCLAHLGGVGSPHFVASTSYGICFLPEK